MDETPTTQPTVRLADVIASLSLATDLATGQTLEHGLRRSLLAVWLGEELGFGAGELRDVYYVSLLGSIGCALEAAAFSPYVKDEIAVGEQLVGVDPTRSVEYAAFFLRRAGEGEPPVSRLRKVVGVALQGPSQSAMVCRDVALQMGEMLDMGPAVRQAIGECHEHWDGKGWPRGLKGEEISLAARLYVLAQDMEKVSRRSGVEGALEVIRRRSGKLYDPAFAARFRELAESLLSRLDTMPAWDGILDAEPAPPRTLSEQDFDRMLEVIANFVDSRSAYTLGHSPAVAGTARKAARYLGLSGSEATLLRRAGLVHDLGRTGVPVTVWEKKGSLSEGDWDRIKGHPSLTELVLARSHCLGHVGLVAGMHHERLDGSGYRSVPGSFLPTGARILAAADAYQTKLEPRPHRGALKPEDAARALRRQVDQGLLDGDAVAGILAEAGPGLVPKNRAGPAGLSDREVEVLTLAVRGWPNRRIAEALFITPKTVGRHLEHIYSKIGVSTRVGATLFALRHNLTSASVVEDDARDHDRR